MSRLKNLIIISLVIFILLLNCSIILPTFVHYSNKKTPELSEINNVKTLNDMYKDDQIQITKKDGEIIQGSFIDIYKYEDSKYFCLYNEFKEKFSEHSIPCINDTITVLLKSNILFNFHLIFPVRI
ncbi:MAG: hypothetical protein R6V04_07285 [bacterium]